MKNNPTLRHLRETAYMSQAELAELLDVSQSRVSRFESGDEIPSLSVGLAYFAVFGRNPYQTFAQLYAGIEEGVMGRGADLERSLRGKDDRASARKRAVLEKMMNRACSRDAA